MQNRDDKSWDDATDLVHLRELVAQSNLTDAGFLKVLGLEAKAKPPGAAKPAGAKPAKAPAKKKDSDGAQSPQRRSVGRERTGADEGSASGAGSAPKVRLSCPRRRAIVWADAMLP